MGGEQGGAAASISENLLKAETAAVLHMPDLIDTNDVDGYHKTNNWIKKLSDQTIQNPTTPFLLIDDLLGDVPSSSIGPSEQKNDNDPFADVSFHASVSGEIVDDIFSGITLDGKNDSTNENHVSGTKNGPELIDVFGSNSVVPQKKKRFMI